MNVFFHTPQPNRSSTPARAAPP